MTIVGRAVELAGIIPDISKLNMTIERRIVISKQKKEKSCFFYLKKQNEIDLRSVSFSPLSGGKRKPRTVIKLISTQGTKRERK